MVTVGGFGERCEDDDDDNDDADAAVAGEEGGV